MPLAQAKETSCHRAAEKMTQNLYKELTKQDTRMPMSGLNEQQKNVGITAL